MDRFNKITSGFVVQTYVISGEGTFCREQEFIAGDEICFENSKGDKIIPPQHIYQPFNMMLVSSGEVVFVLETVLASIEKEDDFIVETTLLKALLSSLKSSGEYVNSLNIREKVLLDSCKDQVSQITEFLYQNNDQTDLSEIESLKKVKAILELYEK